MSISKKMNDAINKQINRELYSGYLYLSMSAYFEDLGLSGFAKWMRQQAIEEQMHAMKFFDFVAERGGRAEMLDIEAPPKEWKTALEVFEETLKHEELVTSLINNLMKIAKEENDYASESFLTWYVDEQVEEEAHATEILDKLKLMKDAAGGVFMLDKELGSRLLNPMIFETIAGNASEE